MYKWAIILNGVGISGGVNVIFEHALFALKQGYEITIVSRKKMLPEDAKWHAETENFNYKTFEECQEIQFDVVIATGWRTAYEIAKIKSRKYLYFVQSIESFFYHNKMSELAMLADLTYEMPLGYITEANWIKSYLADEYKQDACLILNGIDKKIFCENGTDYEHKIGGRLRVLIEGDTESWFKNVPKTVELCRKSEADEIWLMTSSKIDFFEGVDRVFSQIPQKDVSKVYRSCDVLVKLSFVEGMFGPPLEMFHCGGTAITYNIAGSEEYIEHGVNALVAPVGDENCVIKYINQLKHDPELLKGLKKNALKTAQEWGGWEVSSQRFFEAVSSMENTKEESRLKIKKLGERIDGVLSGIELRVGIEPSIERLKQAIHQAEEKKLGIIIYGAGAVARGTINVLDEYDFPIAGIAVTCLENNPKSILGNAVSLLSHFEKNKENYLVFIATSKYRKEVESNLKRMGFKYL